MEIVILAHFAGSPRHGMVYGHYYLAREWVRLGHNVTIVAASFAHTRFEQPRKNVSEEIIDGIRYIWVPTFEYDPGRRLGRVANILSFFFRTLLGNQLRKITSADLVISSCHYPFGIFSAERIARKFRSKLIFEVRDLWPLTLIELGGASPSNLFIRAMQWAEDYAYKNADKVVSVLPAASDYMVARGMEKSKFVFIPNGVDLDDACSATSLVPEFVSELKSRARLDQFVIGYSGRVGQANALHTLLHAVHLRSDPAICVAVLGDGPEKASLKRLAAELQLDKQVLFFDSVPKAQVAHFLELIDVAYVGLQKQPVFRFGVSPTKVNDYFLASKPVIQAIDAPGDIISLSGGGLSCRSDDPEDLSFSIREMQSKSHQERRDIGEKGRSWIVANRDYAVLAKRFLDSV